VRVALRYFIYWYQESLFHSVFHLKRKTSADNYKRQTQEWMRSQIQDAELAQKLIPSYEAGCKRLTPSDTYLQAFSKPNVFLNTSKIEKFTERGVKTCDGTESQVDLIILATGFDVEASYKGVNAFGR